MNAWQWLPLFGTAGSRRIIEPIRCARTALLFIIFCVAVISTAYAQDVASAEQFLRQVYTDEARADPGPKPESIYDPELLALVQKDRSMMEKHEKGLLRVDPVCVCQDPDGLKVLKVTLRPQRIKRVDADVSFSLGNDHSVVGYELVKVDGQWRIHDILGGVAPSLQKYLTDGLAKEQGETEAEKQSNFTVERFLASVYDPYNLNLFRLSHNSSKDRQKTPGSYPTATEEEPETIYDAELAALIRRDQATTPQGEGRVLDFDPICDCQDYDDIRLDHSHIQLDGASGATAAVNISNGTNAKTVNYKLVNRAGVWLIQDIKGGKGSLLQMLTDGIAKKPNGSTKSLPPSSMRECENGVCGLWTFGNDHGEGEWLTGAVASLSSEVKAMGASLYVAEISPVPLPGLPLYILLSWLRAKLSRLRWSGPLGTATIMALGRQILTLST